MPKLKSIYGVFDGTNYHISRTTCGLVLSPTQDYLWMGDQAYDYNTLSPVFDKSNLGFLPLGGTRTVFPTKPALVSNKSSVHSPYISGTDSQVTYGENMPEWSNLDHILVLDKSARLDKGVLNTVSDNSGATVHMASLNAGETLNGYLVYDGTTDSVTGTDSNDIGAYNFQSETNADNTVWATATPSNINQFTILAVDTTNKTIFFRGAGRRTYYSNRAYATYGTSQRTLHNTRSSSLWKATYTTFGDNGSVVIGTPTKISLSYGGLAWYMDSNPICYAGTNNAGEYCFLMSIENNSIQPLDSAGLTHTTVYSQTNYTKTTNGQYLFYKYNATTSTLTLLANLKGTEGFVGDVGQATTIAAGALSNYTPTHFEPSPIGGEDDIYYAFMPCFGPKGTEVLSVLLMTWDKANDTFAVTPCTLTMSGLETISDYCTYKAYNDTTNQKLRLNMVLTKSGADYFVSVFYTHTDPAMLALNTTATWKKITTFQVDAADFTQLTYHSSDLFPALGYAVQNENSTRMMCLFENEAAIYDWTAGGWSKSAYEAGYFVGMTHDDLGRYWGVSVSSQDIPSEANFSTFLNGSFKSFEMSFHIISASLPNLVSCVWEDTDNFVFNGANLSKNLVVNAYDENGARVAKSVSLQITASHAVFTSNGTTTLVTTTSAVADTLVAVSITGAGLINISASFQL